MATMARVRPASVGGSHSRKWRTRMTRTLSAGSWIRRARYVAVAALAVTALAGCSALGGSDSGSSGGNDQVEKAKIKVAVIPGLIDIAGYKRAQAAGYFKAEGLDVAGQP